MPAPQKQLKSALKKTPASSSTSKAGPSKSKFTSTVATKSDKGKSKGSVRLATKPTRFKGSDLESESEGNVSGFEDNESDIDMEGGVEVEAEVDTDEEIERSKGGKDVKKSVKRKRQPTTASEFGTTLTSLLSDPLIQKSKSKKIKTTSTNAIPIATTKTSTSSVGDKEKAFVHGQPQTQAHAPAQQPILALSAHKPPARSTVSLEAKARKQLKAEKAEKEDKARVKDVVEGWSGGDGVMGGQEFEKSLRKTAQRGVIKLFNAILLASKNSEAAITSLSAQAKLKPEVGKKKEKDNILGRGGKEDVLTKETFLDMVRKGSTR